MKRIIPRRKKRKAGRPTLYDPDVMIPLVLEHMSLGASKAEVSLLLYKEKGITPVTMWNWEKKYPEFFNAIKEGTFLSKGWWMMQGRIQSANQFFNVALYVVQMANRFGWRRKDDIVQTIKGEVTQKHEHKFDFGNLGIEEVEQLREIVAKGISRSPKPNGLRITQRALT